MTDVHVNDVNGNMPAGPGQVFDPADMAGDDDRMCRICQEGPDAGHLISPCRCRGSIKYVHRECLDRWRSTSANPRAVFECDQCKFQYSFRRTQVAALLSAKWALHVMTLISTFLVIILSGYFIKFLDRLCNDEEDRWFDSFWWIDLEHLFIGTVMMGVTGFMSLVGAVTTFRPFGGYGFGGIRVGGRGGRGGDNKCEMILLAIVVGIGLFKAMTAMYSRIEKATQRYLARAQEMVENIEADENRPEPPRPARPVRPVVPPQPAAPAQAEAPQPVAIEAAVPAPAAAAPAQDLRPHVFNLDEGDAHSLHERADSGLHARRTSIGAGSSV